MSRHPASSILLPERPSCRGAHYIYRMFEAKEHFVRTLPIVRILPTVALALFLGLAGPIAARAEIVSVPPAGPNSTDTLPPPTVLRGFPPSPPRPVPVC